MPGFIITAHPNQITEAKKEFNRLLSHILGDGSFEVERPKDDDSGFVIPCENLAFDFQLKKELKRLRNGSGDRQRSKKTTSCSSTMICRGVLLTEISPKEKCPSAIFEEITHNEDMISPNKGMKCIQHITPLDVMCKPRMPEIRSALKRLIAQHIPKMEPGSTWHVDWKKRNMSGVDREEVLKMIVSIMWGENEEHKEKYPIKLKESTYTIVIDVNQIWCGASIIKDFHKLREAFKGKTESSAVTES